MLEMSQQLVTLVKDIQLVDSLEDIVQNSPQEQDLRSLYQTLGFKKWLHELGQDSQVEFAYQTMTSPKELAEMIEDVVDSIAIYFNGQQLYINVGDKVISCENDAKYSS